MPLLTHSRSYNEDGAHIRVHANTQREIKTYFKRFVNFVMKMNETLDMTIMVHLKI